MKVETNTSSLDVNPSFFLVKTSLYVARSVNPILYRIHRRRLVSSTQSATLHHIQLGRYLSRASRLHGTTGMQVSLAYVQRQLVWEKGRSSLQVSIDIIEAGRPEEMIDVTKLLQIIPCSLGSFRCEGIGTGREADNRG